MIGKMFKWFFRLKKKDKIDKYDYKYNRPEVFLSRRCYDYLRDRKCSLNDCVGCPYNE